MGRHEIKCINKSQRQNPHERITAIGGPNPNGTHWKLILDEAIAGMKAGKWEFYVRRNGSLARVIIARSIYGNEYLKTEYDGLIPDNLLSLPECP